MSDFSDLMELVKKILPTPAMWLVTTTTVTAAIAIAALPAYLKQTWPELYIPKVLLFQAALISTTLFVGSFVLIVLFLRYINHLNKLHSSSLLEIEGNVDNSNKQPAEITTLPITNSDSPKIASGISIQSTLKENGRYCVSDDIVCTEDQRTLKPDSYTRPYEYTCSSASCKTRVLASRANIAKSEAKDLTEAYIRKTLNVEPKQTNRFIS